MPGPFLWISPGAPARGFEVVPPGGMCLSAFLFLRRPRDGHILLGKYDARAGAAWEEKTGIDQGRLDKYAQGWTIPASHVKHGEDPRDAARRVARDVLGLRDISDVGEPKVATFSYELARLPGTSHYDVCFLLDATAPAHDVARPAWYADLAWHDPRALPADAYARGHDEIVERWLALTGREPA